MRTVCWRQDSLGSASILCERPYSLKAFKNNAFFGTSSCPKTFVGIFRKLARAPHADFYPTHNSWNMLLGKKLTGKAPKYVTGSPPVNNDAGPKFVTVAPRAKHTHRKQIAAPTCRFLDA